MGTASDDEETIEQEENESGVDEVLMCIVIKVSFTAF